MGTKVAILIKRPVEPWFCSGNWTEKMNSILSGLNDGSEMIDESCVRYILRKNVTTPWQKKKYFANRFQKIVFWIIQLKSSSISGRIYHDHDGMIIYLAALGI